MIFSKQKIVLQSSRVKFYLRFPEVCGERQRVGFSNGFARISWKSLPFLKKMLLIC